VPVSVADTDAPGLVIAPASLTLTEGGDPDAFSVRLTTIPTADVTVSFTATGSARWTATITFTAATWNVAQDVTVTPGDDDVEQVNDCAIAIACRAATTATASSRSTATPWS